MDIVSEVERILREGVNLKASAETLLDTILAATSTTSGTLHVIGKGSGMLKLLAARQIPEVVLGKIQMIPVGKGMAGVAVEQAKPVTTCNLQEDDAGGIIRQGARATGAQGAIAIPLLQGEKAVGALGVATREPRDFTRAEIDSLLAIGRAIASAAQSQA